MKDINLEEINTEGFGPKLTQEEVNAAHTSYNKWLNLFERGKTWSAFGLWLACTRWHNKEKEELYAIIRDQKLTIEGLKNGGTDG